MILRRLFTALAVVCVALAVLSLAIVFRGWLTSDIIKTYTWNDGARRYSELHIISQGGLLSFHHSGTTLAAGEDATIAKDRAGPSGYKVWHYSQRASPNNDSPWLHFQSSRGSAHAGVANPNGVSDNWTLEIRPLPAAMFFLALPVALFGVRYLAQRRKQHLIEAGHCPACGYDLRESPDRCPECGASSSSSAVATATALP
ncbi:MAG: hypothetical protein JWM57_3792 [Phycisphaerales bacterium]|nr:hypothetical protein [Phycisphaerales bacterium]